MYLPVGRGRLSRLEDGPLNLRGDADYDADAVGVGVVVPLINEEESGRTSPGKSEGKQKTWSFGSRASR